MNAEINPSFARVLIVEDEPEMAALMGDYLAAAGYAWHWIADGREVAASVQSIKPDLLLLDLMLPGKDGLTVCRELRISSDIPIIMLTARIEEADRLIGLDVGADDYICKTPFSPREVVARVKALLRRSRQGDISQSLLYVDHDGYKATFHGVPLDLTPIEFRLLRAFSAASGKVLSRGKLLDQLHEDNRATTDRAVDSHIKNLRRKLESANGGQETIYTVYGVGYRFDP